MESISNLLFPYSPIWLPLMVVYNKSSAMRYQVRVYDYMLCCIKRFHIKVVIKD